MTDKPIIVWLRQELRLADHPALHAAVAAKAPVVPVYVLDDETPGAWRLGAAKRWWLAGSLRALASDCAKAGAPLVLRRGESAAVLERLIAETEAGALHFTRGYEPYAPALEDRVKEMCDAAGVAVRRFSGHLLSEPERIRNGSGEAFRVFSPFWRACLAGGDPAAPLPRPRKLHGPATAPASDTLEAWELEPSKPDWAGGLRDTWQPGEAGAHARVTQFLAGALQGYATDRNRPDMEGSSRMSPHLSLGEISARSVWHQVTAAADAAGKGAGRGAGSYLRELYWREFSYHLLAHFPTLPDAAFRPEYDAIAWRDDASGLRCWQRGLTGYPVVDAGMRQLWQTGWMHNRVRMITASFLIKHLLIDWRAGERWFWDCLVDADLANNSASWQWVAGSGADAAPYFRVFNPVLQGEKFDPDGDYVRRYVPELAHLPKQFIHTPWQAPELVLREAGIVLGKSYPHPLIDHAEGRKRALEAYGAIKKQAA